MVNIFESQKLFFNSQKTKSYTFRFEQLSKLKLVISKYQDDIINALKKDLNKSSFEAYTTEIGYILNSIQFVQKRLKTWMKTKKVKTPFFQLFTTSHIQPEPKGQVFIIGPFNYPFQLVIEPLIGAIAAGNTIFLKPSEFTPSVSKIIETIIKETFDSNYIHVVQGGVEVTKALLDLSFDHIFFTGSTKVGQIIYEKAAQKLIPVTLELGGKSPTIVDETANIKVTARRIIYGKFLNAGQTCIAPDYIYVQHNIKNTLEKALIDTLKEFYPNYDDLTHIVSDQHVQRLKKLINKKKVLYQGNIIDKKIEPIIMHDVTWDDDIMKDEIFGPILPILTFEHLDEVVDTLKLKPKPLALYIFSESKVNIKRIFTELSFGNGAINDTIMQVVNLHLPFGGIGHSGIGKYHGKASFDVFSHLKTYVKHSTKFDSEIAYPPYTKKKENFIRKILK
ncbi:MAG: aldehyde dehydrogenase [Acholeplasmataceae bacterium]